MAGETLSGSRSGSRASTRYFPGPSVSVSAIGDAASAPEVNTRASAMRTTVMSSVCADRLSSSTYSVSPVGGQGWTSLITKSPAEGGLAQGVRTASSSPIRTVLPETIRKAANSRYGRKCEASMLCSTDREKEVPHRTCVILRKSVPLRASSRSVSAHAILEVVDQYLGHEMTGDRQHIFRDVETCTMQRVPGIGPVGRADADQGTGH